MTKPEEEKRQEAEKAGAAVPDGHAGAAGGSGERRAIVDEVFVKRRIEELISEAETDKRLAGGGFLKTIVKHPLSAALIAAIFSLAVSLLTILNDSNTRKFAQEADERTYYHGSVSELARTLLVRSERGALLYSAFQGRLGDCDEQEPNYQDKCRDHLRELIYDRKKAYDEAYLAWNSKFADYMFNIRGIFRPVDEKETIYRELKSRLESLNYDILRNLDGCLDELYKAYQRTGSIDVSASNPSVCANFGARTNTVRDCAVVLAEELHWLVAQRQRSSHDWALGGSKPVSVNPETRARIEGKCSQAALTPGAPEPLPGPSGKQGPS